MRADFTRLQYLSGRRAGSQDFQLELELMGVADAVLAKADPREYTREVARVIAYVSEACDAARAPVEYQVLKRRWNVRV